MAQNFKRKIENFVCDNCGKKIKGDGYTNHCQRCLWSKHVDTTPGDRASDCKGMMFPLKIKIIGGEYGITHRCLKCGYEKKNKISPKDDFETMLSI